MKNKQKSERGKPKREYRILAKRVDAIAMTGKATPERVKPKRIQNSGYANRMARRKKLEENARIGRTFIDMPHVQKLETVSDWHTQIARIYRRTLTGTIPEYLATKLTYIATAGANLARMLQEIRELETLRQQLEQLQQNGFINREAVEYLPANKGDRDV